MNKDSLQETISTILSLSWVLTGGLAIVAGLSAWARNVSSSLRRDTIELRKDMARMEDAMVVSNETHLAISRTNENLAVNTKAIVLDQREIRNSIQNTDKTLAEISTILRMNKEHK